MNFRIDGCVMTNPGKVRSNNEDNYNLFGTYRDDVNDYIRTVEKTAPEGYALAAVLDGMGGESAGEVASFIAAQNAEGCPLNQVKTTGLDRLLLANQKVCEETTRRGGRRMGTTFVGAYIENGQFMVANVGDSRCYLFRDGVLTALSKDHSMGQRMIDSGVMTEEEARKSKSWHELTQHFGIFPEEFTIEPYFTEIYDLKDGDELLLCSDGLTDMMIDQDIANYMVEPAPIKVKVEKLVNGALERGGRDNVTVMIVRAVSMESDEKTIPFEGNASSVMQEEPTAEFATAPGAVSVVNQVVEAVDAVAAPVATPAVEPVVAPVVAPVAPIAPPVAVPKYEEPAYDDQYEAEQEQYETEEQYAPAVDPMDEEEEKLRKSVKVLTIVMIVLIVLFVGLAATLLYLLLF